MTTPPALSPRAERDGLLMLDICAGLGGASAAMLDRGWQVITLDNDPAFDCDITADIRTWSWQGRRPDLIWCSPPCDEFARESMPWCKTGVTPDMSLIRACQRIIKETRPRYWVIENVRGALPYLGRPSARVVPFYLWGHFPPISLNLKMRKKESMSSTWAAERAMIPYPLSLAMATAIEQARPLFDSRLLMPVEAVND